MFVCGGEKEEEGDDDEEGVPNGPDSRSSGKELNVWSALSQGRRQVHVCEVVRWLYFHAEMIICFNVNNTSIRSHAVQDTLVLVSMPLGP